MEYYSVEISFSRPWAIPHPYMECFNIDHTQKEAYCPLCGNPITGSVWVGPYNCYIQSLKLADVLYAGHPPILFSRRFLDLFEKEGLTGIRNVTEIHFFYRKKEIEERYYYPTFEYSQKTMDYALQKNRDNSYRIGCALCENDNFCNREKYNLYFDGHREYDLFRTYDRPGRIYCNDIFVEFCRKHRIQNIVEHLAAAGTYLIEYDPTKKRIMEKFKPVFPNG